MAAGALANLSGERPGLEALATYAPATVSRLLAVLRAQPTTPQQLQGAGAPGTCVQPPPVPQAVALLQQQHVAMCGSSKLQGRDNKAGPAAAVTDSQAAAVAACAHARLQCFACTTLANCCTHALLSKALLGEAGAVTLLVDHILKLPSPRCASDCTPVLHCIKLYTALYF